jgi:purine-cytosine permease-like protein
VDEPGRVETHGVDYIPARDRHGGPIELVWIWIAVNAYLGILVLGSLPIVFGLSWWQAFWAVLAGTFVGSLLFAPMTLFGPRTGTTDPYTSRAHFGIRGGGITGLVTALIGIGFYALAIWTGGQAIIVVTHHAFGWSTGNGALSVAMVILAVLSLPIAIWGHASVVALSKYATFTMFLLIIALFFVLIPKFNASYSSHGHYLLGGLTATWLLGFSVCLSVPFSYATFAGDYARYFPRSIPDRTNYLANFVGQFVGCFVPLLAGAYAATLFATSTQPFVLDLSKVVPVGFLFPLFLIGLIGTLPQAALCLYSGGLSLQALGLRIQRVLTTLILIALGVLAAFLAFIAYDAASTLTDFLVMQIIVLAPFVSIMTIGLVARRGRYDSQALQVYVGTPGGRYWFWHGFNLRAVLAWAIASVIGFMFADTATYTGPWTSSVSGVDISFWVSGTLGAILYVLLLILVPEPNDVYLPSDPSLAALEKEADASPPLDGPLTITGPDPA